MAKKNIIETKVTKPKTKAPKSVNARQAGKIIGLHSRYALHLKKKYVGQLQDVKSWAETFKEEGLIENVPSFLT